MKKFGTVIAIAIFSMVFSQESPKKSCCANKNKKECTTKNKKECADKKECTTDAKNKKESCCSSKKKTA